MFLYAFAMMQNSLVLIFFANSTFILNNHRFSVREVLAGPHYLWMDNYSKLVAHDMPDVDKGTFHSGLWTGWAAKKSTAPVSMRHVTNNYNQPLPAMPEAPFDYASSVVQELVNSMFDSRGERSHLRFAASNLYKWEVNNVPLKPLPHKVPELFREGLNKGADGLEHLYPMGLSAVNCGENVGFARCIKSLSDARNWEGNDEERPRCKKYTAMVMDVDLFDKMIKVIYSLNTLRMPDTKYATNLKTTVSLC